MAHRRHEYQAAWDGIYVSLLKHFGEWKAAKLFQQDHDEFERRMENGRAYIHGPLLENDAPTWLEEFVGIVADQMTADSPMGPLKVECGEEEGFWEVLVYPAAVELVGGAQDGGIVVPGFSLDLEGLRAAFDSVAAMGWRSLGLSPAEGPYVFVEGFVAGHEVLLQLMAYPPEDEEPGMKLATKRVRQ